MNLTTAVYGSRGYLGRELMDLLAHHPAVDTILPVSGSAEGRPYAEGVPGFHGIDAPYVSPQAAHEADPDVVFFATPGGEAATWAPRFSDATIIDLSRDHRLEALKGGAWTYTVDGNGNFKDLSAEEKTLTGQIPQFESAKSPSVSW